MFDSPYPLRKAARNTGLNPGLIEHIFTFDDDEGRRYLLMVEEYPHSVYAVKFHLKAHRHAANRFSILTGYGHSPRILATVLSAMLIFYQKDELASFVYIGAPRIGEDKANTKRFQLYQLVMQTVFPASLFSYNHVDAESFTLILNIDHALWNPELVGQIRALYERYVGEKEE